MKKKYKIAASLGAVLFPSTVVSTVVLTSLKNSENNSNSYKKLFQNNLLNYGEKISSQNKKSEFWILDKILQKDKRSILTKNLFGLNKNLEISGKPSFLVKKDPNNNYNSEILYEYIIELNSINTKEDFDLIINKIYNQVYEMIRDSDKTFGLYAQNINSKKIIITAYEMQDKTSLHAFSNDFLEYVKTNKGKISKQFKDAASKNLGNLFENKIELFSNEKILNPYDFFESSDSKKHFENSSNINFDEKKLIYNDRIIVTYSKDFDPNSDFLEIKFNFYEISSKTLFEDNINKDFFIYKPKDSLAVNNKIRLKQDKFIYHDNTINFNDFFSLDIASKTIKSLVNLQKKVKKLIEGNKEFENKLDILNLKYKSPKIANLINDSIEKIISIDFSNIKELRKIMRHLFKGYFTNISTTKKSSDVMMSEFIEGIGNLSKISSSSSMLKIIFLADFLKVDKDIQKISFREVENSISVIKVLQYYGIHSLPAWYTLKNPRKVLIEIMSYKLANPKFDFDSLFFQSFNKNIFKKILKNDKDSIFNEILYEIFITFTSEFNQFQFFIRTVIKENSKIFKRIIKSNNYEMESYDKKASLFFRRIFSDKKYYKISRDENSVFKILLKGLKIEHDPNLKNFGAIIKTISNFDFLPKLLKRYLAPNIKNKKWLSNLYKEGKFLKLYEMVVDIKESGLVDFMTSDQKVDELISLLKSLEVKTLFNNRVDEEIQITIDGALGTIKQMIQKPMSQWDQIFVVEDDLSKIQDNDPSLAFNKFMKVFLIFEEDIDKGIVKRIINERKSFFELFNLIISFIKLKKTDDFHQKFMSNFEKLLNNELFSNSDVYQNIIDYLSKTIEIIGQDNKNFLIEFIEKLLFTGFKDANYFYNDFSELLKINKPDFEKEDSKKLYIHNFLVSFIKLIFEDDKNTESNIEIIPVDNADKETYLSNYKNGILYIFNERHLSKEHRRNINILKKIFKEGLISLKKWEFTYLVNSLKTVIERLPEILSKNKFLFKNLISIFTSQPSTELPEWLDWLTKIGISNELNDRDGIKKLKTFLKDNLLFEIILDILNNGFLNIKEESKSFLDKKMNFPDKSFSAILKLINSSFAGITKQEFKSILQLFLNSIEKITKKESGTSELFLSLERNMTLICDAMYGAD